MRTLLLLLALLLAVPAFAQDPEPAPDTTQYVPVPVIVKPGASSPWGSLIPVIVAGLVAVIGALSAAAVKVIGAVNDVKVSTDKNTSAVKEQTKEVEKQTQVHEGILRETAAQGRVTTAMISAQRPTGMEPPE